MVAAWIICAFLLGLAVRQIGLPPLVGFLAAGFVMNALGFAGGEALTEIAHLGVLLLLFTVGLKLRLQNVVRPEVWGSTLIHLAITTLLLGAALRAAFGLAWPASLLLATGLGFSSTVMAAKSLEEKRELRAFHGRVAIGILIVQDLVAVGLLAVSGGHAPSPWALVLLGLPWLRPWLGRILDFSGHGELLLLCGMLLAVGVETLGFEGLGLSAELGALVMGALLADHRRAQELASAMWGLKEVFLVGFFLQIGMSGLPDLAAFAVAAVLLAVLPLKAVLFYFLLIRFRLRGRSSFLAAVSLATYSEFGLIVTQVAVDRGMVDAHWLVVLALTVALSFVVAAPINRFAHGVYARFAVPLSRPERDERHPDDAPISLGSARIAIVGMGRVGTGAYEFLKSRDERVVGLDSDPAKVQKQIQAGRRVVYADAEDPGLWQRLNLDGVHAVLLAVPDVEAKVATIRALRERGYTGLISATNVYPEEVSAILDAGCTTTFNYFDEAGVGFAEHTWEALHPPASATDAAD